MSDLIITGVIDGDLPTGLPKAIELYALKDIPDLSIYGISSANNGGGPTNAPEFTLSGSANAGDYLYVASENPNFLDFFGFNPNFTNAVASINGDDAIELFQNGTIVDVFGDVNASGTGQPWDYEDGWAYRKDYRETNGGTFNPNNWVFSGPNALDNVPSNQFAPFPFPTRTFDVNVAPTAAGSATLTAINEDVANASNLGTTVADLLASVITDTNPNPSGLAITGVDNSNGTWQYSLNGGTSWTDITTVSETSAITLLGAAFLFKGNNTAPATQGWFVHPSLTLNTPPNPPTPATTQTVGATGVTIDTTANQDIYAGYSNFFLNLTNQQYTLVNPSFPVLDHTQGYAISFNLQVLQETVEAGRDRAGFSVIAVSQDTGKAIEIAFQNGLIFGQSGAEAAEFFRKAESITFDTTTQATDYRLEVQGDNYKLFANGTQILTGPLRDYTGFNTGIAPDPYGVSNFVFLGDDTTSAQGEFRLTDVNLSSLSRIRFVPKADYSGNATLQFRAWDGTDTSTNGQTVVNVSQTGGNNPFSTNLVTGTITVNAVNDAPTAIAFQNTTLSLAEDTNTASRIKVADIAITDDGLGTNTLSLTGNDAAAFEIDGSALFLKAGTALDFESKSSYAINVNVDDTTVGATPDATQVFNLSITDVAEAAPPSNPSTPPSGPSTPPASPGIPSSPTPPSIPTPLAAPPSPPSDGAVPTLQTIFSFELFVQFQAVTQGKSNPLPLVPINTEIGGLKVAAFFDENYYLSQNPDVAKAVAQGVFTYGFEHFVLFGINENRSPSKLFDKDYYLATNPDVKAGVDNGTVPSAIAHFIYFGHRENRKPNPFFDGNDYLLQNPDVKTAVEKDDTFDSAFEHYVEFGSDESRENGLVFEETFYLNRYADVAAAVKIGAFASGFEHFLYFGQREGRDPSSWFDQDAYLDRYADVAAAVKIGAFVSAFEHYIYFGQAEGRSPM